MKGYPYTRLRRNRKHKWCRDLVSNITLVPNDLIYPVFIHEDENKIPIRSLPGQYRVGISDLVELAKRAKLLGIPALALFPVIDESLKTSDGREALNLNNLISRSIKAIKDNVPEIGVICDVALDPYTSHGHDGILSEDGLVDNDKTVAQLVNMSLNLAAAGADSVAPSDMMDGRIGLIRKGLEENGYYDVQILSYAAKFASSFYGPFRDAIRASSLKVLKDKQSYQLDFRCHKTAILEMELDVFEGADMLIVKPGLPYLDIIAEAGKNFKIPVLAYQVSGEYAMLKWGAEHDSFNYMQAMIESLIAFKRAGAKAIFSYAALEVAENLR